MKDQSNQSSNREWLVFAGRWVMLVALAGLMLAARSQTSEPGYADIISAALIGTGANLALAAVLLMSFLRPAAPLVILLGDLAIAGAFLHISGGAPLNAISIVTVVVITGLIRPGLIWTAVQVVLLIALTEIIVLTGAPLPAAASTPSSALFLSLLVIGALAVLASYGLERMMIGMQMQVITLEREKSAQLNDMRERSRAIYELALMMSFSLSYDKILEAALEAGRLALRLEELHSQNLTAVVMLFHADDRVLHVVASRRFTRADDQRQIPGKDGIVGKALSEGVPVFCDQPSSDPELQYFVAFQTCRSALCVPMRAGFDNFGVLLYGSDQPGAFTDDHSEVLTTIGSQATIALQNAVLYQTLVEEKERMVEVEEDARKKLARDLHDGPTQSVAAIAMRMSYIARLFQTAPKQVPDELRKVEELARRTTHEIRHMLFTLRPLVLETQGLRAALEQLAQKVQEMHNQAVAVRVGAGVENYLDAHQQGVIFYIIEEAVNNARKHAQAALVNISVTKRDDMIIVQVADNGQGFNTGAVRANYDQRGSLGMVNMRERAALLDATLSVDSMEGKGTVITVVVPLKSPEQSAQALRRLRQPVTKLALAAAARMEADAAAERDKTRE